MFLTLKRKVTDGFLVVADVAGLVLSASGASVVAIFGKLMLAVVLGAIALGFFLRLAGRRRQAAFAQARTPGWCYVASVVLAAVEVALLVEATNLPIRFGQSGFELWHWALVVVALVVAHVVHMQIFRYLIRRRNVAAQP
jgi:hypothetical protein